MAIFNPGTGGSVSAATVENQLYTIIRQIHDVQRDLTKNPDGRADCCDSSIDEDSATLSGIIRPYLLIAHTGGETLIAYPDPFITAGWIEGTGGDGGALNYNHALADRALKLVMLERTGTNVLSPKLTNPNITVLNSVLTNPVSHNARLTINFSLTIESMPSGNGSIYRAKEYI
jgi:hypothetical protein